MRRTILAAVGLILSTGCAHSHQPEPAPAAPAPTASTTGPNPGAMELVRVSTQEEGAADDARNTAALPPQPIESSDQQLQATEVTEARKLAPNELALRQRVQSTLAARSELSYSARHITIDVQRRDVTLSGDVNNEREKTDVQALVERVKGVRRVNNELAVVNQTIVRPSQGSTENGVQTQ